MATVRIGNPKALFRPAPLAACRSSSQPGVERCSTTLAGAGQAPQDGGGSRLRGALGGRRSRLSGQEDCSVNHVKCVELQRQKLTIRIIASI